MTRILLIVTLVIFVALGGYIADWSPYGFLGGFVAYVALLIFVLLGDWWEKNQSKFKGWFEKIALLAIFIAGAIALTANYPWLLLVAGAAAALVVFFMWRS